MLTFENHLKSLAVTERFDELTGPQRQAFNLLINTVASHSLSFESDEQAKRSKDIRKAVTSLIEVLAEKPQRRI